MTGYVILCVRNPLTLQGFGAHGTKSSIIRWRVRFFCIAILAGLYKIGSKNAKIATHFWRGNQFFMTEERDVRLQRLHALRERGVKIRIPIV